MSKAKYYFISASGEFELVGSIAEAQEKAKVKAGGFIWLSFSDPKIEELSVLIDALGIHPLSIEDCFDEEQIPKIDNFPDYTHILFNTFDYGDKKLEVNEVHFFLGNNFIVSVSQPESGTQNSLMDFSELVENDILIGKEGPSFIMHIIMDHIVDNKLVAIEAIEDELIASEDIMLENLTEFNPSSLQRIRRDLLSLRKSLFHERDILMKINRKDSRFIPDTAIFHFSDVYDHLNKFFELTEINREVLTSLTQMNLSLLNNKMSKSANQTNMSVRRLTFITTIFMPLTLLTGIGGMSEYSMMTGTSNWRIAYPLFLVAMAGIGIADYFILRWLARNDEDPI